MRDWRTDPTFAMCWEVADEADLASFSGGPFDVWAVVAGILPEPRQGLDLDASHGATSPMGTTPARSFNSCALTANRAWTRRVCPGACVQSQERGESLGVAVDSLGVGLLHE